jgi:hypothetical protein
MIQMNKDTDILIYNNNNNSYIYFCYYVTESHEPNKIKPRECNRILLRLDTPRYTPTICQESTHPSNVNANNNERMSKQDTILSDGESLDECNS